jgi:UDP-glucose 4-epimerase
MSTTRYASPFEPPANRRELVRLVRQIQALTLELHELRQREGDSAELRAKERTLEQLRWRLAAAARRAASDDLGAAA